MYMTYVCDTHYVYLLSNIYIPPSTRLSFPLFPLWHSTYSYLLIFSFLSFSSSFYILTTQIVTNAFSRNEKQTIINWNTLFTTTSIQHSSSIIYHLLHFISSFSSFTVFNQLKGADKFVSNIFQIPSSKIQKPWSTKLKYFSQLFLYCPFYFFNVMKAELFDKKHCIK